VKHIGDTVYLN